MKTRLLLASACVLALGFGLVPAQASTNCFQVAAGSAASCSTPLSGTGISFNGYSYWNAPDVRTVVVTVSTGGVEIGRCQSTSAYGAGCDDLILRSPVGASIPALGAARLDCAVTVSGVAIQSFIRCNSGSF